MPLTPKPMIAALAGNLRGAVLRISHLRAQAAALAPMCSGIRSPVGAMILRNAVSFHRILPAVKWSRQVDSRPDSLPLPGDDGFGPARDASAALAGRPRPV